jgi:hypothetical protein
VQVPPKIAYDAPIKYLTTTNKNGLQAATVHNVDALPEYPDTSISGTAYCVRVQGLTLNEIRDLHKDVSKY